MATVGFNVPDDVKKRIDGVAEQFVKENGGNKAGFLSALVDAYESHRARTELPGRADEINHVEKLLSSIRIAYMSSLALAKDAKAEAITAAEAEISKAKAVQNTLQTKIDELETELSRAQQQAETAGEEAAKTRAELETAQAKAQAAQTRAEQSEAERSELSTIFQAQIKEAQKRADAVETQAAEAEALKQRAEQAEVEIEQLKSELATARASASASAEALAEAEKRGRAELERVHGRYEERLEVAIARAENEKNAALLQMQQQHAEQLESMRKQMQTEFERYAQKLKELSSADADKSESKPK